MKRLWSAIAGTTLLALLAGGLSRDPRGAEGQARAQVVRRDMSRVVKATGVVRPMIGAEVRVGSRVSGVVQRLHVRVGDAVERGQLLAELDAEELEARCAQAAAGLASAQASLDYAQAELRRKRELAGASLIPPSELDLAERGCAVAEAQVAEAAASLATARTQRSYARIEAPIAGIVASVSTQEGETVAASFASPTFVTLIDLRRLEVWAYVDETDIGRVSSGQPARFTVDTWPDEPFTGQVTTIYPQAEVRDNVINYVAVVAFEPRPERLLRPQMTATVRVTLDRREGALAVPRRAVRREGGRTVVRCPGPDGGPEGDLVRPVTLGVRDETHYEVLNGLREGEDVLVEEMDDDRMEAP